MLKITAQPEKRDICMKNGNESRDVLGDSPGSARGGSGIPIYPKKNRQNTPKYPKFLQIYPKIIEALNTLYLKFKESDILNTHI